MTVEQINTLIQSALEFERAKGTDLNKLPYWRNAYELHYKPTRESSPVVKRISMEGGFTHVKQFCEGYCLKMGYRFLMLTPMFADLEYELRAQSANK